ncbi:NfeD family protein [Nafulsella turpanensis]|uniref:NfeD family protein n=1 Tax=Nafulsella turpanensis TaxID=1265690 RepID=UPI00034C9C99|nr:NfeD family protein [Nafulsella turpanensis]
MVLEWIIVIFLILFGVGLIIAEIIIVPGMTFVGILGLLLAGAGVYMGFTSFGETVGYWLMGFSFVVALGAIWYGLQHDTWGRFSLESTNKSRFNEEIEHQLKVGMTGKTVSELRPQGKAAFGDKIYEVRTFGQYLENEMEVRVAKVESLTVYVEPLSLYK